mmetsp:Transcript_92965/g.259825  ORF Transcript_92965/g.259825 Transcript_92965/m.259825 type:complete len:287 (+) Transcript_92965:48-908(+)
MPSPGTKGRRESARRGQPSPLGRRPWKPPRRPQNPLPRHSVDTPARSPTNSGPRPPHAAPTTPGPSSTRVLVRRLVLRAGTRNGRGQRAEGAVQRGVELQQATHHPVPHHVRDQRVRAAPRLNQVGGDLPPGPLRHGALQLGPPLHDALHAHADAPLQLLLHLEPPPRPLHLRAEHLHLRLDAARATLPSVRERALHPPCQALAELVDLAEDAPEMCVPPLLRGVVPHEAPQLIPHHLQVAGPERSAPAGGLHDPALHDVVRGSAGDLLRQVLPNLGAPKNRQPGP